LSSVAVSVKLWRRGFVPFLLKLSLISEKVARVSSENSKLFRVVFLELVFKPPKDFSNAFLEPLPLKVVLLLVKFFFRFLLLGSGLYSESVELASVSVFSGEFCAAGESSDSELVFMIFRAAFFVARCAGFETMLDEASELVSG